MKDPDYRTVLYRDYGNTIYGEVNSAHGGYDAAIDPWLLSFKSGESPGVAADLGCGRGEWLRALNQLGFTKIFGVDLSEQDLLEAKRVLPTATLIHEDILGWLANQEPGALDLIHAKDIIEHFTKDEFILFLQRAHAALKDGGVIYLSTFNAQSPMAAQTLSGDFTHETAHTPNSLNQCLRATGYSSIRIKGVHHCNSSLKGRVRSVLGKLFYWFARQVIVLRHGKGVCSPAIDSHTALPDLIAMACRDKAST
jgi:SAM-dependent methyltransferase